MKKSISAFAPASVGNMIAGFDVLGFALESPGDRVTVTAAADGPPGVHMGEVSFADDVANADTLREKLSTSVERNIAGFVVQEIWRSSPLQARPPSVRVDLHKGCGVGTGLGSSAASAAAAAFAGLSLLGEPTEASLLEFGLRGESLASGERHADNLAPSLLGGIVGVRSLKPIDVFRIPTPPGLCCAVFQPEVTVLTKEARTALPETISLNTYVEQSATLASLIAGLYAADFARISASLRDIITEPHRAKNIPAFAGLRQDALDLGALGAGIAGSGPTIFALCTDRSQARRVLETWKEHYNTLGIHARAFTSAICSRGAHAV